jgi:hypothetical protein
MARFRDSAEFAPTIDAAAARLGISSAAFEKDFWVSEALRALANGYRDDFVLKAGRACPRDTGSSSASPRTSTSW